MSIIEKAILRSRAQAGKAATPAEATSRPVDPTAGVPEMPLPLAVADLPPVSLREHLALEHYPDLARDFRFLKRPVLARVFGMSRSGAKAGNRVLITSDSPRAGKSFVSLNLAGSMASERMIRVALIDADPVRRSLTRQLGLDERPGLIDLLAGNVRDIGEVLLATDVESLYFLPAGQLRPDATELLASPRMLDVLGTLNDPNLVVLMDSPPLLVSSEGRVLAGHAHHALVVIEAGRTTASEVAQVLELLKSAPAAVSLVLNKAPAPRSTRNEGYYSY